MCAEAGMREVGKVGVGHERQAVYNVPVCPHEKTALVLHGRVVTGAAGEECRVPVAIITLDGKQRKAGSGLEGNVVHRCKTSPAVCCGLSGYRPAVMQAAVIHTDVPETVA